MKKVNLIGECEEALKENFKCVFKYSGTNLDGHLLFKNELNFQIKVTFITEAAMWIVAPKFNRIIKF